MTEPVIIGNATRIYALCEFPSQIPRYVGKTIQPLRLRMVAHKRIARRKPRLPVHRWLAKRESELRPICIKWLETIDSGSDWASREKYWILKFRKDGERLLNLTEGGEGLAGLKFTDEHRHKIAKALNTRKEFDCIRCGARFTRKLSEIKSGHNKFCSRNCANKYNKGSHK